MSSSAATTAAVNYAKENPDKAVKAGKAVATFARDNPELTNAAINAAAGAPAEAPVPARTDAQIADDQARKDGDNAVVAASEKTSNCCRNNCGSCGVKIADCKDSMDNKIKDQPLNRFRLMLRFCNTFMAILVIFCVVLGVVTLGIDSYSSFVISAFLAIGGTILFLLEMPCCCDGMEGKLRRNLPFLYYARGRAWGIVLLAFLSFGLGVVPILIGVFCLLPYGLMSRYCIAIHPKCSDRLVTTQSADEIADIEAQGLNVYDHFLILDTTTEAELMTTAGKAKLIADLESGPAPVLRTTMQTPVEVEPIPAHQEPQRTPADNPFADAPSRSSTMEVPEIASPIAATNAFGQQNTRA